MTQADEVGRSVYRLLRCADGADAEADRLMQQDRFTEASRCRIEAASYRREADELAARFGAAVRR